MELAATDADDRGKTRDLTAEGLERWGIACTEAQLDQFMLFRDVLLEWNAERMNLTRLTSPEEIAAEHFLDSASLLTVIDVPRSASLLDIGSGAGFPALPLAILRPDLRVTLLEATAKKLVFCEAAARAIGLDLRRLSFVHGRAEDERTRRALGARYDLVTARAVAPLAKLVPWCAPYLKRPAGILAALKGASAYDEAGEADHVLRALGLSGEMRPVAVPFSERVHTIVICRPV